MKKMTRSIFALIALVAFPMTAFALQPMADSSLDNVTAQAGVSIAVDDVLLYQSIDKISYTDQDYGFNADGSVDLAGGLINDASFNINGLVINRMRINAITDGTSKFAGGADAYGAVAASGFKAQALTIDVAEALPTLSAGKSNNLGTPVDVAGVLIELPTIEVIMDSIDINSITITDNRYDTATVAAAADPTNLTLAEKISAGMSVNSGASFGSLAFSGVKLAVLGGTLEIAAH